MPDPLPLDLPADAGTIVDSWGMVDAPLNWVDVFVLTDKGRVFHGWYRPDGRGWQGPEELFRSH